MRVKKNGAVTTTHKKQRNKSERHHENVRLGQFTKWHGTQLKDGSGFRRKKLSPLEIFEERRAKKLALKDAQREISKTFVHIRSPHSRS